MARWVKSHQQMQIFKTASAPTVLDGVKIGDLWVDITSGAIVKVCTAISPSVLFDILIDSTSPVLTTPTLGAASATSLSFSSTSGIIGTTTNDSAAAGSVGEYKETVVLVANMTAISSDVATNITSVSLTAGDWIVWGLAGLETGAVAQYGSFSNWLSTTSASSPDQAHINIFNASANSTVMGDIYEGFAVPGRRFSLSGTTTVYLSCIYHALAGTAATTFGKIMATRIR